MQISLTSNKYALNVVKRGVRTFSHEVAQPLHIPTKGLNLPPPEVFHPSSIQFNIEPKRFQLYSRSNVSHLLAQHAPHLRAADYEAAAAVFPMRTNNYVVEQLVDFTCAPADPIFQLVFPQPGMLDPADLAYIKHIQKAAQESKVTQRVAAERIRARLNPHPAGQKQLNVPRDPVSAMEYEGLQHKYRETVLVFPSEGQFCHAFCTYCFRWAQFTSVGSEQQFSLRTPQNVVDYVHAHRSVSDILFTGGDPMVMKYHQLRKYIEPLIRDPGYVTDPDATDVLRLFEEVVRSGKSLSIMAHFSHYRELETPVVQEAIRRIRMTGAVIRCQAPLIKHVNDDPLVWSRMWRQQTRLGLVPYYMFVERDTGAKQYFEVPLARAYDIYKTALQTVSGISRTVRGPSMSTTPGKVQILGISEVAGEKVFVCQFVQARNPGWMRQVFFAEFDAEATWLDQLRPAFGQKKFFYEDELEKISSVPNASSGQLYQDGGPISI